MSQLSPKSVPSTKMKFHLLVTMEENPQAGDKEAENATENSNNDVQQLELQNTMDGVANALINSDDHNDVQEINQEDVQKNDNDVTETNGYNEERVDMEKEVKNEQNHEEDKSDDKNEPINSTGEEEQDKTKLDMQHEEDEKEKNDDEQQNNDDDDEVPNVDEPPVDVKKPKIEEKPEDPTMYNGFPKRLLENHIQSFEEDGTVPNDTTERTVLSSYIRHLNVEAVIDGDYPNAERYEKLLKAFSEGCLQAEAKYEIEKKETDIDIAIARTEELLETLKDTYIKRVVGAKQRDQQDIERMMHRQELELSEFDDYWADENNLRIFSKPSARLLNLRAQEKRLLIAKMFDEADQIKREADKLEKEEAAVAANDASIAIAAKRKQLEAKQRSDLIKLRQHAVKLVDDISTQYNKDKSTAEARLKKLKKDKLMLMQTPPAAAAAAVSKAQTNNNIIARSFGDEPQKTVSPRSKAKMDAFRQSGQPRRLILKPVCPGSVKPSRSGIRSRAQKRIVL